MPNRDEMALMAHLMRRAGFGATREELEARVAKGYEATVEELLNPEEQPPIDEELLYRYFVYRANVGEKRTPLGSGFRRNDARHASIVVCLIPKTETETR